MQDALFYLFTCFIPMNTYVKHPHENLRRRLFHAEVGYADAELRYNPSADTQVFIYNVVLRLEQQLSRILTVPCTTDAHILDIMNNTIASRI